MQIFPSSVKKTTLIFLKKTDRLYRRRVKMFPASTQILVVDDFPSIREVVVKSCGELGYANITQADSAASGWERLIAANPKIELILTDWNMPGGTGIDLLKKVRADAKYKSIPVILITTENEKSRILEAISAGASNYIVKPFTTEGLKQKFEAVFKALPK